MGRRPGRGHEPQRRHARVDVQLRLREAAHRPAGRRPVLLPEPHGRDEPALAARGQLVRRDDPAQHRRHARPEGGRVLHRRLPVRPRPPRRHAGWLRARRGGRGGRPDHRVQRAPAAAAQAGRDDRLPRDQQRRPERHQRAGRVRRHLGRRPGLRRHRRRHLLGWRGQRHHRGEQRPRRRARRRRGRRRHRPGRRRHPQGRPGRRRDRRRSRSRPPGRRRRSGRDQRRSRRKPDLRRSGHRLRHRRRRDGHGPGRRRRRLGPGR